MDLSNAVRRAALRPTPDKSGDTNQGEASDDPIRSKFLASLKQEAASGSKDAGPRRVGFTFEALQHVSDPAVLDSIFELPIMSLSIMLSARSKTQEAPTTQEEGFLGKGFPAPV